MTGDYPPGVTGAELGIIGANYEKDFDLYPCPQCGGYLMENGYSYQRWVFCLGSDSKPDCDFQRDLEPLPDPSDSWLEDEDEVKHES